LAYRGERDMIIEDDATVDGTNAKLLPQQNDRPSGTQVTAFVGKGRMIARQGNPEPDKRK
jgi:hypothetical protein